MNSCFSTRWSWIASLAALIGAAGCASSRNDLATISDRPAPAAKALPESLVRQPARRPAASEIVLASAEELADTAQDLPRGTGSDSLKEPRRTLENRVEIPKELPGSDVPRMRLPRKDGNEDEYAEAIRRLFPSLSDPPPMRLTDSTQSAQKMTLFELEQTALANSPIIGQAQADITTVAGVAIQAGTAPNPLIGYEADTVGSNATRNYQGVFATQLIKTAGKLQLQQAIHNVELMNTQLALRQTRIDVLTQVRRQYFNLLVARESIKINEAIVKFTHELYRIQVEQVPSEVAAGYEPSWLRTLAVQARGSLVTSRNNYVAAWKQLTASLNTPQLPLADLLDNPEMAVPELDYDTAISHILSTHTEAQASRNLPIRARLQLRLAEITPIPDINVYGTVQRDFTTPGMGRTTYNTQIGIPLPVFDQNKGNILSARGSLVRATQEITRVENDLRSRLAEAFSRFETNRYLVDTQRRQILPDSVRAYRGTYERHVESPEEIGFTDVIVAQQNLLNVVTAYLNSLSAQWNAFVDIAHLLQVDSLNELHLALEDRTTPALPAGPEGQRDVPAVLGEMLTAPERR